MKKIPFILLFLISVSIWAQNNSLPTSEDSTRVLMENLARQVDTLHLRVSDIIISGNKVTKDYIILREIELKKGQLFKLDKYINSRDNLNNLGLFAKVYIKPVPVNNNQVSLNVDVQERPYLIPIPGGGVDEGEYFKKLFGTLKIKWENFRGRNESLGLYGRIFFNPAVKLTYKNPWYAGALHLFTNFTAGFSRTRNQSIVALGIPNGQNTIRFEYPNFEWFTYNADLTFGKFLTRRLSVYTDAGYNYVRATQFADGRTFNPDGKDMYLNLGLGITYESRDNIDFATKGVYLRTTYTRYGFINKAINSGRYIFESQTFIPVSFSKSYYITLASRLYTSLAIGAFIPIYQHEYLGYSDNYVRGWSGKAYEGEDVVTVYNELRIPIYQPRYINGSRVPIIKGIPVLKNMDIKHGLYLTVIYDIGTVLNNTDKISKQRFISGAGIGLDAILPFGLVGRADWVFRLAKPMVGQVGFSLSAKF